VDDRGFEPGRKPHASQYSCFFWLWLVVWFLNSVPFVILLKSEVFHPPSTEIKKPTANAIGFFISVDDRGFTPTLSLRGINFESFLFITK
jgi:hypothetical protein